MNKRIFILFINVAIFSFSSIAQNKYDVRLIPTNLLKNANVVKRNEEVKIEIKSIDKAIITTKYALTILNVAGEKTAGFYEWYSKLVSIKSIDGKLYDAYGKKIKSVKNSDINDLSGTSEGTIADDSRIKSHNFNYTIYPYTVEYECTLQLNGIFYFPKWQPIDNENLAVEQSVLKVQCSSDYKLRYKSFNYIKEPEIETNKAIKIYKWNVDKTEALISEKYNPSLYELTTSVFLAPSNFEIEGYTGSMENWKDFGKFIYSLNHGRDVLPTNIKDKVHQLILNANSSKEKINILYKYLQENTRYVSIQLGIGGWQTFDANYVSTNGYGDCKALSNYMFSLLKEAGIKSYYTLIKAGVQKNNFLDDFPSNQFNHIIICVPLSTDTVWLECTSQTLQAGYLSSFTSNRKALLIDENGGTLVNTPTYSFIENNLKRKINATINNEGGLSAIIKTSYFAEKQDYLHNVITGLSKDKLKEYLNEYLDLPSYDIVHFSYNQLRDKLPEITEMLEINSNNYASVNGKRLFIAPNIFNKTLNKLDKKTIRNFEINITDTYTDIDSVEINLPLGYVAENIPENIAIESPFGKYTSTIIIRENKIIYRRLLLQKSGKFPASEYSNLSNYFEKIYNADRAKIVFVKE